MIRTHAHSGGTRSSGDNRFQVSIPKEPVTGQLFISVPGYVHEFKASDFPLPRATSEPLVVTVPRGGNLALNIQPTEPFGNGGWLWLWLTRVEKDAAGQVTNSQEFVNLNVTDADKFPRVEVLRDLPAGSYSLRYQVSSPKDGGEKRLNHGYTESRELHVGGGTSETVTLAWKPYDKKKLSGETTIDLSLVTPTGEPVTGLPFRVIARSRTWAEIEVATGTFDARGHATLANLSKGLQCIVLKKSGEEVGSFKVSAASGTESVVLTRQLQEGDKAPDFPMVPLDTNTTTTLSAFKGKVVYVDFWATWCGPCQGPTGHLVEVALKESARWGDRVKLVALSGDEAKQTLVDHLKKKGWESPIHHLTDQDCSAFQSQAFKAYGITGIPTAILVDQKGVIRFIGHPAGFDLVRRIDELLAGK